jgi:hypothetical protein
LISQRACHGVDERCPTLLCRWNVKASQEDSVVPKHLTLVAMKYGRDKVIQVLRDKAAEAAIAAVGPKDGASRFSQDGKERDLR